MPAHYLEIAVVLSGLVLLMVEAFFPAIPKKTIGLLALIAVAGVTACLPFVCHCMPDGLDKFYTLDQGALFYKGFALVCTAVVIIIGLEYLPVLEKYSARCGGGPATGEFFCMPLFICAGMMWMASAADLAGLFVSLELVTIAFYVMVAFMRRNVGSLEAGVKYLILGALSTGFLVYGIAWLYGVTGQTELSAIGEAIASGSLDRTPLLFAFALLTLAVGFKVAAVPVQFWVPDVYQGAPTPVTAYLSVGSKAAGFVMAARLLGPFIADGSPVRGTALSILLGLAGATLIVGNLAAIPQTNFKRLLGYSSIAHAGFLLLALASDASIFEMSSSQVVQFYLGTYLVTTLLAFLILAVINRVTGSDVLAAFNGLHQKSPFLALTMTLAAASLAGVPLTAGFLGKFYVFGLATTKGLWALVAIAVACAAAGFYYYFKVIRSIYWNTAPESEVAPIQVSLLTRGAISVLAGLTLVIGVYPALLLNLVLR